jgi:S1-C subfamily serine protease
MKFITRFALLILLVLPSLLWANAEHIVNGKRATVLIDLDREGTATAFCVSSSGVFVTNAHVVKNIKNRGTGVINLIVEPGEKTQRIVKATVLLEDANNDLALLQVTEKAPQPFSYLELGDEAALRQTSQITTFGYPFGKLLADSGEYPSVTVSMGKVTALRRSGETLHRIQVDASLNPGSSGGPMLDLDGKVVGVVVAGIKGAGVNFAIPTNHLRKLLTELRIIFRPESIPPTAAYQEREYSFSILTARQPRPKLEVTFEIDDGTGVMRKYPVRSTDNERFTVTAAPLVKPGDDTERLRIVAKFNAGTLIGTTTNFTIKIDGKPQKLSSIENVWPSRGEMVNLGKTQKAVVTGLEDVEINLGETIIRANLQKADHVSVHGAGVRTVDEVRARITVKADDGSSTVATEGLTVTAGIALSRRPTDPIQVETPARRTPVTRVDSPATKPAVPEVETTLESIRLPAPIVDVCLGGAGRYVIAHAMSLSKLLVIDLADRKITQYITVPGTPIAFAASMDSVVVLSLTDKIIERFSLKTGEKLQATEVKAGVTPTMLTVGHASAGPVLLGWQPVEQRNRATRWTLLDLQTLADTGIQIDQAFATKDRTQPRAAANGRTFLMTGAYSMMAYVRVAGKSADLVNGPIPATFATLGSDGRNIYTPSGVFGLEAAMRMRAEDFRRQQYKLHVPATEPGFHLSYTMEFGSSQSLRGVEVFVDGNPRALVQTQPLPEMADATIWDERNITSFTPDKRFILLPSANLLATIPMQGDRIWLRPLNLDEALKKADGEHLFVTSYPPAIAKRGSDYLYRVAVQSRRGDVKYKLDSGPAGMTIAGDGTVTWKVPADAPPESQSIVLRLSDASGLEIFHTFVIRSE